MNPSEQINQILFRQQEAWNRGDARGYSQDCDEQISFTNILGQVYFGKEAFEERHAQIFATIFKGSSLSMTIKRLHFPLPTIALVDLAVELRNYASLPPGVKSSEDGVLRTSLLQVFIKDENEWRMIAYHNVDVKSQSS